jgi:hypothetical protein
MSELPELPDNMPIREVRFPTQIKDALFAAGLKTVGQVRTISDEALLALRVLERPRSRICVIPLVYRRPTELGPEEVERSLVVLVTFLAQPLYDLVNFGRCDQTGRQLRRPLEMGKHDRPAPQDANPDNRFGEPHRSRFIEFLDRSGNWRV